MSFSLKNLFGSTDGKFIASMKPMVAHVNALEEGFSRLENTDFPKQTDLLKERLEKGENLDDIFSEAFALVREASKRTLGQRHFDVQIMGGITLHNGKIAEMRTGEGKTLVATLSAYLNALLGEGVHIVTVNDYLSRRDAVWMGQIYNFLGLSIGVINDQNNSFIYDSTHNEKDNERDEVASYKIVYEFLRPCTRREAYSADITYGTNHQFGFDYLRDNLASDINFVVQRGHNYAIVDEIDSILIDEARTPLIISSETEESEDLYRKFADVASKLVVDVDYKIDEKHKAASLTDAGITRAENLLGFSNIYTEKGIKYVHHLETAVRAKAIYIKDRDYVVKPTNGGGEVLIVDAFTGRTMPGRRWSEGLHQAVEAKEGVKIEKETKAVASITFQNYFRLYKKLSGMTGTAKTSEEEFRKVYGLDVVSVPTNKESKRLDKPDLIFQTEKGKWKTIVKKVKELQSRGQPVLIGTVSIEKNELLSAYLKSEGIKHTLLNAKNHEREGEIIAEAGKPGSVTIATNMAGRGVDIKLGGPLGTSEDAEMVKNLGGLFVLGTERHEARRIDDQLRGRSGRQGDPGETQFFVSMEDDLMRVFGGEGMKNMMGKLGLPEDYPIENRIVSRSLESAQAKIEGFHFDSRKHTLEYDNVLNHQRNTVYGRRRKMLEGDKEFLKEFIKNIEDNNPELLPTIEEKRKMLGGDNFTEMTRRIALYANDILWTEHIETMEYLRSSVNLRAYGQRDPLVEYKKEGLRLFRDMEYNFDGQVKDLISKIHEGPAQEEKKEAPAYTISHDESNSVSVGNSTSTKPKAGRNDPCPCGAKKLDGTPVKFKHCHGK